MARISIALFLLCATCSVVWCGATYGSGDVEEMETYLSGQPQHLSEASSPNANAVPPADAASATASRQAKEAAAQAAAAAKNAADSASAKKDAKTANAASANKNDARSASAASSASAGSGAPTQTNEKKNKDNDGASRTLKSVNTDSVDAAFLLHKISTLPTYQIVLASFALLIFSLWFIREFILAPKVPSGKKIPPIYREGLPVVGTLISFAKAPLKLLERGHEACPGAFTVRFGPKRITFLTGAVELDKMFGAKDTELDLSKPYRLTRFIFGERVLYDAPVKIRAQQIKMLATCLETNKLKSYTPLLEDEIEKYVAAWGDKGEIDVPEVMSELIILTAARCLLGPDVRENVFADVARLFSILDKGMQPISVLLPTLPIKEHKNRDVAHLEMIELFSKIIQRRKADPTAASKNTDILQSLMGKTYNDGTPLSDKELSGMLIALLFAGQHTSSVTAAWTGLFLFNKNNKEWLAKVMEEQEKTGANKGGMTWDLCNQLTVLHACTRESLRMYPPLIFLMRHTLEDFDIGNGRVVPKNDLIFASPAHAGRQEAIFANPDAWEPDRFLPPRDEHLKNPVGNISFGKGIHHCLGEQFGLMQVKTIWSTLLRLFEFEATGPLPKPDYSGMVVGPIHSQSIIKYTRRSTK